MKTFKQLQVLEEFIYQSIKKRQVDFTIHKALKDSIQKVSTQLYLDHNIPGPGAYNEINTLSNSGKYISSRNTGYGKRFFDKEKRINEFDKKAYKNLNPGPGSYISPSDFGQYGGDTYNTISFHDRSMSRNNSQKRN